ncbi:hypothetical protein GECvBN6_gp191 [Salmonella phage GEC_vB_N6]|nr:hypothetical protein GECvBN6_gp191 [Salmonella phage GEC_vB_N6]
MSRLETENSEPLVSGACVNRGVTSTSLVSVDALDRRRTKLPVVA